jgi:PAS domain S-box-containing protein
MFANGSSWSLRYGVSVGSVVVAAVFRLAINPAVESGVPYATFFVAVLIIAWALGFRPALVATVLSVAAAEVVVFRPSTAQDFFGLPHQLRLAAFLLFALLSVSLIESASGAQRRAAALAAEMFVQRERFRTALSSIADGVIVTDRSGKVVFLNAAAEKLTGWGQEALRRPIAEVYRLVDAATRKALEDPVRATLRGVTVAPPRAEAVLLGRDGTARPVEERAAPVRDGHGDVTGVVLTIQDVDQRQRDEEALRTSEALYRTLTEALPQIVWTAAADGTTQYINRQWFDYTGTTPEDLPAGGWQTFLHPDESDSVRRAWRESVRGQQPFRAELRLRRRDGAYRWFLAIGLPVRSARGQVISWIATATDIDDIKRTEETLKRADRRKNEFLAMLAHELRNPLAPIRHSVELLRSLGPPDPNLNYARDVIDRQAQQLTRLVDDLLDVSRITRGLITLRKAPIDLAEAMKCAAEISRPLTDSRNQTLTVTLPTEPLRLAADLTRLAQVIANLLNNAAKYTEEGGHIWLSAERDGHAATIRVRDNGAGISAEMLPRVFDLFTQVDRTLDRSEGGLGIGLTLVRRLVEAHGGTVTALSEGAGRGSEFIVRLPLLSPGASEPSVADEPSPGAAPAARRRILIVDDHRDAANSLAVLLRLHGQEVRTAHDGLEAVEAARAFRPDVVLLDIGLPRLNGLEVARRLRENLGLTDALLVAVTGYGQLEDRGRSREAGFDAHLVKPVDLDALMPLLAKERSSIRDPSTE